MQSGMYQLNNWRDFSSKTTLFQLVNNDITAENLILKGALLPFQSLTIAEEIGQGKLFSPPLNPEIFIVRHCVILS